MLSLATAAPSNSLHHNNYLPLSSTTSLPCGASPIVISTSGDYSFNCGSAFAVIVTPAMHPAVISLTTTSSFKSVTINGDSTDEVTLTISGSAPSTTSAAALVIIGASGGSVVAGRVVVILSASLSISSGSPFLQVNVAPSLLLRLQTTPTASSIVCTNQLSFAYFAVTPDASTLQVVFVGTNVWMSAAYSASDEYAGFFFFASGLLSGASFSFTDCTVLLIANPGAWPGANSGSLILLYSSIPSTLTLANVEINATRTNITTPFNSDLISIMAYQTSQNSLLENLALTFESSTVAVSYYWVVVLAYQGGNAKAAGMSTTLVNSTITVPGGSWLFVNGDNSYVSGVTLAAQEGSAIACTIQGGDVVASFLAIVVSNGVGSITGTSMAFDNSSLTVDGAFSWITAGAGKSATIQGTSLTFRRSVVTFAGDYLVHVGFGNYGPSYGTTCAGSIDDLAFTLINSTLNLLAVQTLFRIGQSQFVPTIDSTVSNIVLRFENSSVASISAAYLSEGWLMSSTVQGGAVTSVNNQWNLLGGSVVLTNLAAMPSLTNNSVNLEVVSNPSCSSVCVGTSSCGSLNASDVPGASLVTDGVCPALQTTSTTTAPTTTTTTASPTTTTTTASPTTTTTTASPTTTTTTAAPTSTTTTAAPTTTTTTAAPTTTTTTASPTTTTTTAAPTTTTTTAAPTSTTTPTTPQPSSPNDAPVLSPCSMSLCWSLPKTCSSSSQGVVDVCVFSNSSTVCTDTEGFNEGVNAVCCQCLTAASPFLVALSRVSSAVLASVALVGSATVATTTYTQSVSTASLACTWSTVRSFSQAADWVLSPIGVLAQAPSSLSPDEWAALGNLILLGGAFVLHFAVVAFLDVSTPSRALFPALTVALVVFMSQGTAMFAMQLFVRIPQLGAPVTFWRVLLGAVSMAVSVCPLVAVAFVQWRWHFLEERELHDAHLRNRARLRHRVVFFFTSSSYWAPLGMVRSWGSVFAMYRAEMRWFHSILLSTNILTAVVVGASREPSACPSQVTLILCLYVVQLCCILYFSPFRQPFLQIFSVLTTAVRAGEMAVLVIFSWLKFSSAAFEHVGLALHLLSTAATVLLTSLCLVAIVLDLIHTSPAVLLRERDLLDTLRSREEEEYLLVDRSLNYSLPQRLDVTSRRFLPVDADVTVEGGGEDRDDDSKSLGSLSKGLIDVNETTKALVS